MSLAVRFERVELVASRVVWAAVFTIANTIAIAVAIHTIRDAIVVAVAFHAIRSAITVAISMIDITISCRNFVSYATG